MTNIVAALAFVGLIVGAVAVSDAFSRESIQRRRITTYFIAYVLGVCLTAGSTMTDLWPFSSFALMTPPPARNVGFDITFSSFYGVTADGQEHPIDYRAWEPVWMPELAMLVDPEMNDVPEAQRRQIGALLLDMANEGRRAAAAGRDPGHLRRFLGPFRAVSHVVFREYWEDPAAVPPEPFVQVRWYREYWNIEERFADRSRIERVLGFEYP